MYEKTIPVQCSETVTVSRFSKTGRIFMELEIHQDDLKGTPYVILTNKQARRLRKALKRALRSG